MNITKEELNKLFEENGYYMEDYVLSKAYLSLYYLLNRKSVGQEVYSLCLDGPSGAGKTSFVEAYTKVASKLLGKPVHFINFQLDAETGKDDLYEDVDIVATFENDTSKIRIPGTILKAIKLVNEGHYVILKMDEYDKARDSTDTFFNNFLQEGMVNTIQHGDIKITPENFGKLQVFLCKNDLRVDLSEPMMRRNRIIRLDYMKPDRLFKVLQSFVKKNNLDEGLLNLVVLIYESIYNKRDMYTKLPSCSECQQAIMDAYLLLQIDGFTKEDIYSNIIENMLKFEDDVKTFEANLQKPDNKKLKDLIEEMKKDETQTTGYDINSLIAKNIFVNESEKLTQKITELDELIASYRKKFVALEEKIALQNGSLIGNSTRLSVITNFGDESEYVKRGYDIFDLSKYGWTNIADLYFPSLIHDDFINKIIENSKDLDITIYENGLLLKKDDELSLIVINDIDNDGKSRYRVMSSLPVVPISYIDEIKKFVSFVDQVSCKSNASSSYSYSINSLVHTSTPPHFLNNGVESSCDQVELNVYGFVLDGTKENNPLQSITNISENDVSSTIQSAKKIMAKEKKVITK